MKSNTRHLTALLCAACLAAWPAMAQQRSVTPDNLHAQSPQAGAAADKPAMLGVVVERISDELRYQLPLIKPGAGLIVRKLVPDGPAAQAQVEKLDILLLWNDQLLVHPAQLQVLAQSSKPGDNVDLAYLHHGVLTKSRISLAAQPEAPAKHGGHHQTADPGTNPAAQLGALLGSDTLRQAADALAQSGIDVNAVAGMLKGLDLGKAESGNAESGKAGPAALLGGKIAIIAPDGTRREINLGDVMKANGNLGELLKGLDLGKSDPAALLGSKIILIGPDGRQKEINLAELLKSAGAIDELLKGLTPSPMRGARQGPRP